MKKINLLFIVVLMIGIAIDLSAVRRHNLPRYVRGPVIGTFIMLNNSTKEPLIASSGCFANNSELQKNSGLVQIKLKNGSTHCNVKVKSKADINKNVEFIVDMHSPKSIQKKSAEGLDIAQDLNDVHSGGFSWGIVDVKNPQH